MIPPCAKTCEYSFPVKRPKKGQAVYGSKHPEWRVSQPILLEMWTSGIGVDYFNLNLSKSLRERKFEEVSSMCRLYFKGEANQVQTWFVESHKTTTMWTSCSPWSLSCCKLVGQTLNFMRQVSNPRAILVAVPQELFCSCSSLQLMMTICQPLKTHFCRSVTRPPFT